MSNGFFFCLAVGSLAFTPVPSQKGFGLAPKLLILGILCIVIASAMTIFKTGTVALLQGGFKLNEAGVWFAGSLSWGKFFFQQKQ